MALVDVRRAYFYAPARRRVFVELPPEDYQPGDEHMCGLLRYSLYGTRDAAHNWEEELATTLSDLKLTRGSACSCVWRGYIKVKDIVATVHGDDITIDGGRSAVEFFIRRISKKYEIKKQAIGEDPDLEKSGRILNRVIEWNRDGITTEADQRHVREILKGLGLERANRSATLCAVERKDEGKGESRRGQGQTQTEHEVNFANKSDDRDRPQMADDDDPDSQALEDPGGTDPIDLQLPRGATGSSREQPTPQSTAPVTRLIDTKSLLQVTPYHGDKASFLGWTWSFLIAVRAISKPLFEGLKKIEDNMNQDFRKS